MPSTPIFCACGEAASEAPQAWIIGVRPVHRHRLESAARRAAMGESPQGPSDNSHRLGNSQADLGPCIVAAHIPRLLPTGVPVQHRKLSCARQMERPPGCPRTASRSTVREPGGIEGFMPVYLSQIAQFATKTRHLSGTREALQVNLNSQKQHCLRAACAISRHEQDPVDYRLD